MSQIVRPNSDISNGGVVSTGANLFSVIDEAIASDADYLTFSGGVADTCTVGLESGFDPGVYNDWVITVRACCNSGVATGDHILSVQLYEGASLKTTNTQLLTDAFATYNLALSTVSITDYSALRIKFTNDVSMGSNLDVYVSQAFLTYGDYVASGGGSVTATTWMAQGVYPFPIGATSGSSITDTGLDKGDIPEDYWDAVNGQVCSFSGLWFPARRIVMVDGLPYADIYAPRPDLGPPDIPLY